MIPGGDLEPTGKTRLATTCRKSTTLRPMAKYIVSGYTNSSDLVITFKMAGELRMATVMEHSADSREVTVV